MRVHLAVSSSGMLRCEARIWASLPVGYVTKSPFWGSHIQHGAIVCGVGGDF